MNMLYKIFAIFLVVSSLAAYSAGTQIGVDLNGQPLYSGDPNIGPQLGISPSGQRVFGTKQTTDSGLYPQFTPLPLVNNKQWYWLKLAANSTQGYIVAWDANNQNSQCLATFTTGGAPTGPNCRRPPINSSKEDLVALINLNGKQDAKGQSIGILTCNSPDYVKAWGKINTNDAAHWCNVVDAKLNPKSIKVPAGSNIPFPQFVPFFPFNGVQWFLLMPTSDSTQWFMVSWDTTSNKGQCLATIAGTGNTAQAACLRPPLTASLEELANFLKLQGQRDEQQRLISTLVCDSAQYVKAYGQVDPSNQDQWCNMVKKINPNPPPLTEEQRTQINNTIKHLEDSGQYPVLDRSNSVAGPDANNNGVRDDVEAYINKTWTDPKENKAVMQFAKAMQSMITTDVKDKAAVENVGEKSMYAINCLADTIVDDIRYQKASDEIQAMTLNTVARTRAYLAFDKASDGSVFSIPQRDTCDK